jgi:hypothetical protein
MAAHITICTKRKNTWGDVVIQLEISVTGKNISIIHFPINKLLCYQLHSGHTMNYNINRNGNFTAKMNPVKQLDRQSCRSGKYLLAEMGAKV